MILKKYARDEAIKILVIRWKNYGRSYHGEALGRGLLRKILKDIELSVLNMKN